MKNQIQKFVHSQFGEVRTIIDDEGNPWFVGKDVTKLLGYKNASKAIDDHVHKDDKLNNVTLSSLGQRGGWLINEYGLYDLAFASKLPQAQAFKRWVEKIRLEAMMNNDTVLADARLRDHVNAYRITV